MHGVEIAIEDPRIPDVLALVEALDAYHTSIYPAESNHFLDIDTLAGPDGRFLVARRSGRAVGCGALWVRHGAFGEVKRMFVEPEARGFGVARALLAEIEAMARTERLPRLLLETGVHSREALRLYRRAGFVERGPYDGYGPDPLSVFMEKALT